jgi:hypothetical protein
MILLFHAIFFSQKPLIKTQNFAENKQTYILRESVSLFAKISEK